MDLSGGLDPLFETFMVDRPDNPEMRDSATLWAVDEDATIALPRVTIDAIAQEWDRPWVQVNMVTGDGRTFRVWDQAIRTTSTSVSLGSGPLSFECIDPFRHWRVSFAGEVLASEAEDQRLGRRDGKPVEVAFAIDARMAQPPWLMGGMTVEAARLMRGSVEGALMGGLRYEQMCRVSGFVEIGGRRRLVNGTGMRVKRQGVRRMSAATGHCQHSVLFPSGRAIGAIAFAPRPDGSASFNEGFVIDRSGAKHAARLVEAPWMTRLITRGESVPLLLETELGGLRVEGETLLSLFDHHFFEMADTSVLQQGVARYSWDGETAVGFIERCTLRNQLDPAD